DRDRDSDCKRILAGRFNIKAALAAIKSGIAPMNNASQSPSDHNNSESSAVIESTSHQLPQSVNPQEVVGHSDVNSRNVVPYDCGCKAESSRSFVYAVGRINYDIPLPGLQDSMNAMLGLHANLKGVADHETFIQYLLGGPRMI